MIFICMKISVSGMFAKSIDGQMIDRRILQVHYYAWTNLMSSIMSEASIESLTANR